MMVQHNGVKALSGQPNQTPQLTAWVAEWPSVRRELETLVGEYQRRNAHYDSNWTKCVFEMMDSALAQLAHRARWLQTRLERPEETFWGVLDPEYYARLAAKQIG